jgi:hypothetical protein
MALFTAILMIAQFVMSGYHPTEPHMPSFTNSPRLFSAAVKAQSARPTLGVGPTCKIIGQAYIIWS